MRTGCLMAKEGERHDLARAFDAFRARLPADLVAPVPHRRLDRGVVGLEEIFVDGHGLRECLEVVTVVAGFGLFALWRRTNRIALDLARRLR